MKRNDDKHAYDPMICAQCGSSFLARRDSIKRGMGRFCTKSCQVKSQHSNGTNKAARKRELHHFWKGKIVSRSGYVLINVGKEHPRAYRGMYVFEHVLIAEKILGRPLNKNEVVHHIDENPANNSPSNLAVMSRGRHTYIHKKGIMEECEPLSIYLASPLLPAANP